MRDTLQAKDARDARDRVGSAGTAPPDATRDAPRRLCGGAGGADGRRVPW